MNAAILSNENSLVKFSYEVTSEKFEEGLKFSYNKNKKSITIPGFRKGMAPRKLIESQYGVNYFFEDAIDFVFPDTYEEALKELNLDVVSRPTIDIDSIDKATGIKFIVDVTVKPIVTLGEYKGLEIEKVSVDVTEEEVLSDLKKIQDKNVRKIEITDRKAETSDVVTISYDGSVDGVHFDGGQSDSHDLEIGSHTFIEGFEDQLIGHEIGDTFDVNVTFPSEYHAPDLAGKAAVFAVEIKGITAQELPELNDEFAEDVSEFSTLEEYKASIMDKLKEAKTGKAKQIEGEKLLDAAISNMTVEVPQIMYDNKIDSMMREFEENIGNQGLTIDIYCQYMGVTKEQMRENFVATSEKSVKARLLLEEVAKIENIVISEDSLTEEIGRLAESYGLEVAKAIEMFGQDEKDALEADMLVHEALKLMEDSAIVTEIK